MESPKATIELSTAVACQADLTPRSGEPPYLGQPFRISLREIPPFLRPRQDDFPNTMKPLGDGAWVLTTEPYLHLIKEPVDAGVRPWLHFTYGLAGRLPPIRVASMTRKLSEFGKVLEVGPCKSQIEWKAAWTIKSAKITVNQVIMDRMRSLIGDPDGDASWFFSRLNPRLWPARIYSSYSEGTLGLWVRLY